MAEQIKVIIKKDGTAVVKPQGVAGPGCKQLTKGIEDALGEVIKDEKTEEYNQTSTSTDVTQTAGNS